MRIRLSKINNGYLKFAKKNDNWNLFLHLFEKVFLTYIINIYA